MPQVISPNEDAGQRRRHTDRLAPAMSWSALTGIYHPSDVTLVAAGIATVIASCVRPLFKWLEFRAFISLWRDLGRGHEAEAIQHLSDAIRAFRSRGKADNTRSSAVLSHTQFSNQEKRIAFHSQGPEVVAGLTLRESRGCDGEECVEVAPSDARDRRVGDAGSSVAVCVWVPGLTSGS
jgi:hypothetical protein